MSVLIKGMEMPKACVYRENGHLTTCPLYDVDGYCGALNTEASHKENGKLSGCPLVEIPPHGDLIDRNGIKWIEEEFEECCHNDRWTVVEKIAYKDQVDKLPTIIPAEEADHA